MPDSTSAAKLYGRGVFTTLGIVDGVPFLWTKHWRRLVDNAARLGIDVAAVEESAVKTAVEEAIAEKRLGTGPVRISFFDERPSPLWTAYCGEATSMSVIAGKLRPVPERFNLTVSPYPINSRSPLAGIKSCNYLENLLVYEEAAGRGFHEAVRLNEMGKITSAAMANIFWLKDGMLFTPSLSTGCLAGTTREFVPENIECNEVEAELSELDDAEAIFLTSAGLGVTQVAAFESRKLTKQSHQINHLLPRLR